MKLKKYILLVTVLLLNCSTSYCQNKSIISSTGEQTINAERSGADSIKVAITDIRKINEKLIKAEYNDSIILSLKHSITATTTELDEFKYAYDIHLDELSKNYKTIYKLRAKDKLNTIISVGSFILGLLIGVSL